MYNMFKIDVKSLLLVMQASGNHGLNWGQSRRNAEREVDFNTKTESNTHNNIMWVGSERE